MGLSMFDSRSGITDGGGIAEQASARVVRGGSWNNHARNVRAAYRNENEPDNRNNNLGFRCLRIHARAVALLSEQAFFRSAYCARQKGVTAGVRVGRDRKLTSDFIRLSGALADG